MNAVRIDGTIILKGKRHIDLLFEYRDREGLTDEQIDTMFDAGRIEFGSVWLEYDHERQPYFSFSGDDARDTVYTSIDRMIEINGRPTKRS